MRPEHSLSCRWCASEEATGWPRDMRRSDCGPRFWLGVVLQRQDNGRFRAAIRFGNFLVGGVDISPKRFEFPEQLLLVLDRGTRMLYQGSSYIVCYCLGMRCQSTMKVLRDAISALCKYLLVFVGLKKPPQRSAFHMQRDHYLFHLFQCFVYAFRSNIRASFQPLYIPSLRYRRFDSGLVLLQNTRPLK